MSELTREMIPIIVMYGFVLLLAPFIGITMWVAFDGDRLREPELEVDATTAPAGEVTKTQLEAREALGAA